MKAGLVPIKGPKGRVSNKLLSQGELNKRGSIIANIFSPLEEIFKRKHNSKENANVYSIKIAQ